MFATDVELIRIENKNDGKGVFRSENNISCHSSYGNISKRHDSDLFPTPYQDEEIKLEFITGIHHFGFLNLEQFNIAFTNKEVEEFIQNLNFRVYKITVSSAFKSKYQVIFDKRDIIEKVDISYLFI